MTTVDAVDEHEAPVKLFRSYAVCEALERLLKLGAVPFDFERLCDEPADPGPFRKGAVTNMSCRDDVDDDDDADEEGLGWRTGVTTNPIS